MAEYRKGLAEGWRVGDANSPSAQRHHRVVFQCLPVMTHDFGDERNTLLRGDVRQAHQSSVRDPVEVDELAEVGVDGNQNPVLGLGAFEQCSVPGIRAERTSFKDIMPLVS